MTVDGHQHSDKASSGSVARRRMPVTAWLIIGVAVLGIVIYLFVDHLPHVIAALPYVAIIGMAAMHLFGHRHHGGHHQTDDSRSEGAHQHVEGEPGNGSQDRS